MNNPNETQIGGTHYNSSYQHWDFVYDVYRGRYLESSISKYVVRWRKKNGVQDLLKAKHYTQKLIDLFLVGRIEPISSVDALDRSSNFLRFVRANSLIWTEEEIVRRLATWQDTYDLQRVVYLIDLLSQLLPGEAPSPAYVNQD